MSNVHPTNNNWAPTIWQGLVMHHERSIRAQPQWPPPCILCQSKGALSSLWPTRNLSQKRPVETKGRSLGVGTNPHVSGVPSYSNWYTSAYSAFRNSFFFFFNFFFPHPMAAASSSHALSKVKQSMCPDSPWGGLFTIWNSVSWLPVTSALWWVQENCDWFCTPLSISLLLGWEGRSRAALQILSRSGIPSVLQTAPPFTSQALRSGG